MVQRACVGWHHAGLDVGDRMALESLFRSGALRALVSTSTLAVGVNLPAHLVVVRGTTTYGGRSEPYPDLVLEQMVGRAGRPQFDTCGTAVIMTKAELKAHYDAQCQGRTVLESNLLCPSLAEHLNAELSLKSLLRADLYGCVAWARATFFYVRLLRNPGHYGIAGVVTERDAEEALHGLCRQAVEALSAAGLVNLDRDTGRLLPTSAGQLMARQCISLDTMQRFSELQGKLSIADLLWALSCCSEFADMQIRNNEKATLNALNGSRRKPGIRFPLNGRVKTTEMKVNCLLQAMLGSMTVADPSLAQDLPRITVVALRLSRSLLSLLLLQGASCCFTTLLSAVTLFKCLQARLWEDSLHVARQIDHIGPALSSSLVRAGLTTVEKLANADPREIELVSNRRPPFGSRVVLAARRIPKHVLDVTQESCRGDQVTLVLSVRARPHVAASDGSERAPQSLDTAPVHLLLGDADDKLLFHQRIPGTHLSSGWTRRIVLRRAGSGDGITVGLISSRHVGVDVRRSFEPRYAGAKITLPSPWKGPAVKATKMGDAQYGNKIDWVSTMPAPKLKKNASGASPRVAGTSDASNAPDFTSATGSDEPVRMKAELCNPPQQEDETKDDAEAAWGDAFDDDGDYAGSWCTPEAAPSCADDFEDLPSPHWHYTPPDLLPEETEEIPSVEDAAVESVRPQDNTMKFAAHGELRHQESSSARHSPQPQPVKRDLTSAVRPVPAAASCSRQESSSARRSPKPLPAQRDFTSASMPVPAAARRFEDPVPVVASQARPRDTKWDTTDDVDAIAAMLISRYFPHLEQPAPF